jgi:hypothetical protein
MIILPKHLEIYSVDLLLQTQKLLRVSATAFHDEILHVSNTEPDKLQQLFDDSTQASSNTVPVPLLWNTYSMSSIPAILQGLEKQQGARTMWYCVAAVLYADGKLSLPYYCTTAKDTVAWPAHLPYNKVHMGKLQELLKEKAPSVLRAISALDCKDVASYVSNCAPACSAALPQNVQLVANAWSYAQKQFESVRSAGERATGTATYLWQIVAAGALHSGVLLPPTNQNSPSADAAAECNTQASDQPTVQKETEMSKLNHTFAIAAAFFISCPGIGTNVRVDQLSDEALVEGITSVSKKIEELQKLGFTSSKVASAIANLSKGRDELIKLLDSRTKDNPNGHLTGNVVISDDTGSTGDAA